MSNYYYAPVQFIEGSWGKKYLLVPEHFSIYPFYSQMKSPDMKDYQKRVNGIYQYKSRQSYQKGESPAILRIYFDNRILNRSELTKDIRQKVEGILNEQEKKFMESHKQLWYLSQAQRMTAYFKIRKLLSREKQLQRKQIFNEKRQLLEEFKQKLFTCSMKIQACMNTVPEQSGEGKCLWYVLYLREIQAVKSNWYMSLSMKLIDQDAQKRGRQTASVRILTGKGKQTNKYHIEDSHFTEQYALTWIKQNKLKRTQQKYHGHTFRWIVGNSIEPVSDQQLQDILPGKIDQWNQWCEGNDESGQDVKSTDIKDKDKHCQDQQTAIQSDCCSMNKDE